jgi:hypothetical protein
MQSFKGSGALLTSSSITKVSLATGNGRLASQPRADCGTAPCGKPWRSRKHGVLCCSHAESYSVYRWTKAFRVVGVSGLALAVGKAAAGSPGTLLVACTAEMWLEIFNRTAEN